MIFSLILINTISYFQMLIVKYHDVVDLEIIKTYAKAMDLRIASDETSQFNYAIFLHKSVSVVTLKETVT